MMIARLKILFFAVVLGLLAMGFGHAEMTGRQVMEEQEARQKVDSEFGEEVMMLVDKSGSRQRREVRRYGKEKDETLSYALLAFLAPADIRGTALLTWNRQGDQADDQWLYMPAHKKMQRIAKGSKKNYFMGTDFTYEDMQPENMDNFTYTILKSKIAPT